MHTTIDHIHVRPEHIADFIEACRDNHETAINVPGKHRFDVLQASENPGWFVLYEAYSSAEATAAHKLTAHYARWRDTVADWMGRSPEKA